MGDAFPPSWMLVWSNVEVEWSFSEQICQRMSLLSRDGMRWRQPGEFALALGVSSCKIPTKISKLVERIRIKGFAINRPEISYSWGLEIFCIDRILTRCPSNIFLGFSIFICMQEICMYGIFIFMPPRWIFLWAFTHCKITHMGLLDLWCNSKIFIFFSKCNANTKK